MFVTYTLNQVSAVMQLTTEFESAIATFLSETHLCFMRLLLQYWWPINHYKRPDNPARSTGVLLELVTTTTTGTAIKRQTSARPCNLPLHNGVGSYKEKQVGRQTSRIDSTVQGCAVRLSTEHNNRQSIVELDNNWINTNQRQQTALTLELPRHFNSYTKEWRDIPSVRLNNT
jgi:hypothetical protein